MDDSEQETKERERKALKLSLKKLDGQELTAGELAEIRWLELEHFRRAAKQLPKGVYADLAGKERTQIKRHAEAFGLPLAGTNLDLAEILQSFHDFLARNNKKILQVDEAQSAKKVAEARKIEIQIENMEIDLQERRGELISRSLVREKLAWLASQFSSMSEDIGRRHGTGPQTSINDFLTIMNREIQSGDLKI